MLRHCSKCLSLIFLIAMAKFRGFSIGVKSFFKAIPFIFNHNLWWAFLIPLILNIMLYLSGFMATDALGDYTGQVVEEWLSGKGDSRIMELLPGFLSGIIKVLFHVAFFFIFAYLSGFIILIVLSPLLAFISEKTEKIILHNDYPFEWSQFFKDIWRGILIALRNLVYEIMLTLIIFVTTLIPVLNIFSAPLSVVLLFLISSYFYGFSYMDYTCERKRMKVKESISFMRKYRGMTIANGALFSLTLLIPFCGLFLGGFTAIIATVGATLAMNKVPELNEKNVLTNPNHNE